MSSGIVSAGLVQHDHASTSSGNKLNQAPLKPVSGNDGANYWSAIEVQNGGTANQWGVDVTQAATFDNHGFRVKCNSGNVGVGLRWATSADPSIPRWGINKNATAESGSDVGSDLEIKRYSDAGSGLTDALSIKRSTGHVSVGVSLGVPTQTPASASATGVAGTITWDTSYIYICTATNTWKRVAIATW